MRVLSTSATGFIGYHAARRLYEEGHSVHALVRSLEKAERVLGPLHVPSEDRVQGDMTDPTAVARAMEGCDALIHAAAGVSVMSGQADTSGSRAAHGEASHEPDARTDHSGRPFPWLGRIYRDSVRADRRRDLRIAAPG